jgi:hypothetical protein
MGKKLCIATAGLNTAPLKDNLNFRDYEHNYSVLRILFIDGKATIKKPPFQKGGLEERPGIALF